MIFFWIFYNPQFSFTIFNIIYWKKLVLEVIWWVFKKLKLKEEFSKVKSIFILQTLKSSRYHRKKLNNKLNKQSSFFAKSDSWLLFSYMNQRFSLKNLVQFSPLTDGMMLKNEGKPEMQVKPPKFNSGWPWLYFSAALTSF